METNTAERKLLVLDLNGLFLHRVNKSNKPPGVRPCDEQVRSYLVWLRPGARELVDYCFEHFDVAVWSSAIMKNVQGLVDFLFGDRQKDLVFAWDQTKCTDTGQRDPNNRHKPLFLKELEKVYVGEVDGVELKLSDEFRYGHKGFKRQYDSDHVLLIDDDPYKASGNITHTAIHPPAWKIDQEGADEDQDLREDGRIRKFLVKLAESKKPVRDVVEEHAEMLGLAPEPASADSDLSDAMAKMSLTKEFVKKRG